MFKDEGLTPTLPPPPFPPKTLTFSPVGRLVDSLLPSKKLLFPEEI